MKRLLALGIAALAALPATASASTDTPVMSVSVTVEIGSAPATVAEAPQAPVCASPELTRGSTSVRSGGAGACRCSPRVARIASPAA